MIKVIPQISCYKGHNNQNKTKKSSVSFSSSCLVSQNDTKDSYFTQQPPSKTLSFGNTSNTSDKKVAFPFNINPIKFPWVKNKNLRNALNQLNKIEFDKDDIEHVQSLGVVLPFKSGKDAVKFIEDSNIEIKFAPLSSKNIHAQFDFEDNSIKINEIYRNTQDTAELLAISEAILHEAGHAKDQDGESTLQEEIDCLAMNAMAHRTLRKKYPNMFLNTNSLIIDDGVSVYADLFFDESTSKSPLIKRLNTKYGHLPIGDYKHPSGEIALQAKH